MDQADGYASFMMEIKEKSQEQENKGNTEPTGAPGNDVVPVLHKISQRDIKFQQAR
jgi:hypothetical protein